MKYQGRLIWLKVAYERKLPRSFQYMHVKQVLQESSQVLEVTNSMSEPHKKQRIVGGSKSHKVSMFYHK